MTAPLSEALADAASALETALGQLEREIAEPRSPVPGMPHGSSGSRPPWNSPVACALTTIHAGVRELETDLRYRLSGACRDGRGGSDANTLLAVRAVLSMCHGADYKAQSGVIRKFTSWEWQARIALGEAEQPQRLPRKPGQPEPACPYCLFTTLRMRPLKGEIRCVYPQCRDRDGNPPVAHIEYGRYACEWQLVWNDSTTGLVA